MHVMDTECEKIGGGGCLTAESAPELAAKPNESLLVVNDAKTTSTSSATTTSQIVVNKAQEEMVAENEKNLLVNGTSGDHHHHHHHYADDVGGGSKPAATVIDAGGNDTAAAKHSEMEIVVEEEEEEDDDEDDDDGGEELTASDSATVADAVDSTEVKVLNVVHEEDEEMDVDIVKGTKENSEEVDDDEEEEIEEENNEEEVLTVEAGDEEVLTAEGGEEELEEDEQEEVLLSEDVKEYGQLSTLSSKINTQSVSSVIVSEETAEIGTVGGEGDVMSTGSKDEEETGGGNVVDVEEEEEEEEDDEDELLLEGEEEEVVDSVEGGNTASGKEAVFGDNVEEDEEEEEEQEHEDVPEEEQSEDVDHQNVIMVNKKTLLGNGSVSIELTKEKSSSPLTPTSSIMETTTITLPANSLQQQKPVAVSTTTSNSGTSVVLVSQQPTQKQTPTSTPIPPPTQSLLSSALTTPTAVSSSLTTITMESAPAPVLHTTVSPQLRKERLIIIDDAKVTNLKLEPKGTVNNAASMAAAISSLATSLSSQLPSVTATPLSLLTAAVTANRGGEVLKEDHATITSASTSSSSSSGGGAATSVSAIVIPINEDDDNRTSIRAAAFSIASKLHSQKEAEKRKLTGLGEKEVEGEISSGSESDTSRKKIKVEPDLDTSTIASNSNNHNNSNNNNNNNNSNNEQHPTPPTRSDHQLQQHIVDDDRERYIQDFIAQCSQNVEEMDRAAERLHKEVETLVELARAKELEWNAIVRVRKMREEMLERLLRKRRLATEDFVVERTHLENSLHKNVNKCQGNNQLMMVPIVSSSPGAMMSHRGGPPPVRLPPEYGKQQRPILPKPYSNMVDPNCTTREGRNGPIVDVKSIIADYRSRHPENVPRRGRRMRGGPMIEQPPNRMSANPSLISMANMALGSGASIRTVNDSPYNLSQDHSRPSSTDPTRGGPIEGGTNMGYKDVLVQFAKMTSHGGVGVHGGKGPPPNGIQQQPQPPPPPYPEVTLHPVSRPGSSPPTPASSSLLHGILTKSNNAMSPAAAAAAAARPPANFSPTLARLLTAPDRPPHPIQPPPHFRPQHPPRVSIADILSSSKKSRNEITITPVSGNPTVVNKPKEDVVLLQDDDETEGSDRLVIDESADNEEIPQCQGCRQKPAQFVCAGCGNQWYCSRECQVTAWEEHSDVCSG